MCVYVTCRFIGMPANWCVYVRWEEEVKRAAETLGRSEGRRQRSFPRSSSLLRTTEAAECWNADGLLSISLFRSLEPCCAEERGGTWLFGLEGTQQYEEGTWREGQRIPGVGTQYLLFCLLVGAHRNGSGPP